MQSTILVESPQSAGSTGLLPPSARFPRYGRLLLSSHTDASSGSGRGSASSVQASDQTTATSARSNRKPVSLCWFGSALDSPAAMAGILWCHNIGLRVSLPEFAGVPPASLHNLTTSTYRCPPKSRLCLPCRSQVMGRPKKSIFSNPRRRHITVPFLSSVDEKAGSGGLKVGNPDGLLDKLTRGDNVVETILRRISMVDSPCPKELTGFSTSTLNSAARICTYPLYPIAFQIRGWVLRHPLKDLLFQSNPYDTEPSVKSESEDGDEDRVDVAIPDGLDVLTVPVQLYRVWTGPAVYEHVKVESPAAGDSSTTGGRGGGKIPQMTEAAGSPAPKFSLRGPLAEGQDFVFTGKGSGEIGLSLQNRSVSPSSQPNLCSTGSVVFFRPGRFWICGLMGLLPESVKPPCVDTSNLWSFSLPSARDVGTVRFSPNGIYIHVLSEGDAGLP